MPYDKHAPGSSVPEAEVHAALKLLPHPEGGHYRAPFLLAAGERSCWHRIDASKIWIWQAGAPLLLGIGHPGGRREAMLLAADRATHSTPRRR